MSDQRHLRRLSFVWQKQPVYFVTTCVAGRRPLLARPDIHTILQEEWTGWRERHGWTVGRYVVMPDHVHFFATPLPAVDTPLNVVVGKWKEWTAKRILKATGGSAPLWQPEFFDHLLRSKESLAEKWDYMRENPVRAGLVTKADDWPYAGSVDFA
jgi:REP element-mobilizing transposase RayT